MKPAATGAANGAMMGLFARSVALPSAHSLAVLIYRLMPNSSDFTIAKDRGLTVIATTRQESKQPALEAAGADQVVIDDGQVGARVEVDGLFELVGPQTIFDSLKAVREGGRACISGFLELDWNVDPTLVDDRRTRWCVDVIHQNQIRLAKRDLAIEQLDGCCRPIELEIEGQAAVEELLKASRLPEAAATTAAATAFVFSATRRPAGTTAPKNEQREPSDGILGVCDEARYDGGRNHTVGRSVISGSSHEDRLRLWRPGRSPGSRIVLLPASSQPRGQ